MDFPSRNKKLHKIGKQAEAEVVPSSSLVELEVEVGVEVAVGVEVDDDYDIKGENGPKAKIEKNYRHFICFNFFNKAFPVLSF